MSESYGIEYFPMETNVFVDSAEVFDLMDGAPDADAGFALFGRYMAIVCRVYREGPALHVDERCERKLERDLGLPRGGFADLMASLVSAGLLDGDLWERERVVTSHGIQRRWRKIRKARNLPKGMTRWSLLSKSEGRDDATDDDTPSEQPTCTTCTNAQHLPGSDLSRQEKRREEKKEEEREKREEKTAHRPSGEEDEGGEAEIPCMAAAPGDGAVFLDVSNGSHPTALEALRASYREATGRDDFARHAARIRSLCPKGCRGDPRSASECFELCSRALLMYDPAVAKTPAAITRKLLTEDRGRKDG